MYFILCASISKSNGACPDRQRRLKFLSSNVLSNPNAAVDSVYHSDWGRIVATLIRNFGDFDIAEEAAQEAFAAAVDQWRATSVPESPAAWIIQTARHKAIDRLRRQSRFNEKVESYASELNSAIEQPDHFTEEIPDDRLRLIFTCCHPALAPAAQVALRCARCAALRRVRSRGRFWCRQRRGPSDWCVLSGRFVMSAFLTMYPKRATWPGES